MLNETTKQLIRDDVTKAITLLSNKFTEEAVFDIAYKVECSFVICTVSRKPNTLLDSVQCGGSD